MKFLIGALLMTCILAIVTGGYVSGNGQPGCKTTEELQIRIYRNNWDPTAYWKCDTLNEPAVLVRCPKDTAFMDSEKDCVLWDNWEWEQPVAPPSEPNMKKK